MAVVVVAEDDEDIRDVLVRVLRRGGHTPAAAADGAAALQAVREMRPDVVVSDIDMPVMTGVELCQAMRADAGLIDIPVIFVSGSLLPGDTRPAEAGVTVVLAKPFRPADLLDCIGEVLA